MGAFIPFDQDRIAFYFREMANALKKAYPNDRFDSFAQHLTIAERRNDAEIEDNGDLTFYINLRIALNYAIQSCQSGKFTKSKSSAIGRARIDLMTLHDFGIVMFGDKWCAACSN